MMGHVVGPLVVDLLLDQDAPQPQTVAGILACRGVELNRELAATALHGRLDHAVATAIQQRVDDPEVLVVLLHGVLRSTAATGCWSAVEQHRRGPLDDAAVILR